MLGRRRGEDERAARGKRHITRATQRYLLSRCHFRFMPARRHAPRYAAIKAFYHAEARRASTPVLPLLPALRAPQRAPWRALMPRLFICSRRAAALFSYTHAAHRCRCYYARRCHYVYMFRPQNIRQRSALEKRHDALREAYAMKGASRVAARAGAAAL